VKLKIADDLSLPLDAVTQTFLIVGKRGSGKSNTAARLVEQFHRARLPFVVLDPVDTWWGLTMTDHLTSLGDEPRRRRSWFAWLYRTR
jgi:DNA helicase HerA-like ATPase